MKYIKQFLVILSVSLAGELLSYLIPVSIPASIYGIAILFALLCTGIVKLENVRETGKFLVEIMSVMFVPSVVGIMDCYTELGSSLCAYLIAILPVTVIVMAVSGLATQYVRKKEGRK